MEERSRDVRLKEKERAREGKEPGEDVARQSSLSVSLSAQPNPTQLARRPTLTLSLDTLEPARTTNQPKTPKERERERKAQSDTHENASHASPPTANPFTHAALIPPWAFAWFVATSASSASSTTTLLASELAYLGKFWERVLRT